MKKQFIFIVILLLNFSLSYSQTTKSAKLKTISKSGASSFSTTKDISILELNNTQRYALPDAPGSVIYNTSSQSYQYFNGTNWVQINAAKTKQPVIKTTIASNITPTQATSGGTITGDNNSKVTARGICWSTHTNPTTADSYTSEGSGNGGFISQITGLLGNMTYFVRAYAKINQDIFYGNEISFNTPPFNLLCTYDADSTIVTLKVQDYSNTGGVVWQESTDAINWTTIPVAVNDTYQFIPPRTQYYRAMIKTSASESKPTVAILVKQKMVVIQLPVVSTTAPSGITAIKATSGGSITSDGGSEITARGVCWSTHTNPTTADFFTSDGTGIGDFISQVTGLMGNTTYYLRAYATNIEGVSYGNEVSFKTSLFELSSTYSSDSLTVTLTILEFPDGASVEWQESADSINWTTIAGAVNNPYQFTLTKTQYYRAMISSIVPEYPSQPSATILVKQKKVVIQLPVVSTTAPSGITAIKATSGGSVTSDGGSEITARGVCWSTHTNPTTADFFTSDGTGIGDFISQVTGLMGNTTYYLRAYATNIKGVSYGNEVSFNTSLFELSSTYSSDYMTVTLTILELPDGASIEWQQSADAINWTTIPGAVNGSYQFVPLKTQYYRAIIQVSATESMPTEIIEIKQDLEPETVAYITGLSTSLSTAQKERVNNLVKELKTRLNITALTDIFDVMYILAGETQESSLKNLVKNAHHATATATPSFTAFKGFKGDKISQFINTNYNPSTGTLFHQNDASMGGYIAEQTANSSVAACAWGVESSPCFIRFLPIHPSFIFWQLNSDKGPTSIATSKASPDRAFYIQNRVDAAQSTLYKNGSLYDIAVYPSNGIPNGNVYLLARNVISTGATEFSDACLSFWFAGKGLNEAQIAIINDEVEKYMVSIHNAFQVNITAPTVIFAFDDGNAEHATLTKSIFDARGQKCTFYVVTDWIGTSGFMTLENLRTLFDAGYDIECHSKDHTNLTTLTVDQVKANYEGANAFWTANNLPIPKHHAYPGGAYNTRVLNGVYRYRQTARRIGNVNKYHKGYIMDLDKIETAKVIDGMLTDDIMRTGIDLAKTNNALVIFYGHGVYETTPTESGYINPIKASALASAIDYAIAKGVQVKTMSEVFQTDY